MDSALALTLLVLSTPHLLYAYVWIFPKDFLSLLASREPIKVFAKMAGMIKVLQFFAFWAWYFSQGGLPSSLPPLGTLALGVAAVAAGQTLNISLYKAIGVSGVYYGCRLGAKVPWHNGFPFNVVSHPQYVGCVLSILGVCLLVATPAHSPGIWQMCSIWSAFYVITGVIEDYF